MLNSYELKIEKVINFLIVLSPILCIYSGIVSGINLFELIMILLVALQLFFRNRINIHKTPLNVLLIIFLFYMVFSFILNLGEIINTDLFIIFARLARMIIQIIFLLYICVRWFNFSLFKKYIVLIGLIVAIFLILQYTSYTILDFRITGVIKSLQYNKDLGSEGHLYRASSFFLEPAHCSQFLLVVLTILIFDSPSNNLVKIFILIIAMIISMSGVGLIGLIFLASLVLIKSIFSIRKIKINQNSIYALFLALFLILIITLTFDINSFFNTTISRFLSDNNELMGAFDARFEGYEIVFNEFKNGFGLIIGKGYGNTAEKFGWFATIPYFIYCCGFLGCIIFLTMLIFIFIKNKSKRFLVLIIVFLSITTDALHDGWLVFLLAPILYS